MSTARHSWLAGFALLGAIWCLPGLLAIPWHYHIDIDPQLIGLHFLALNAGFVAAVALAQRILTRSSARSLVFAAAAMAAGALAGLSFVAPPETVQWRILLLGVAGSGAGLLSTCLFTTLGPSFHQAPASSLNRAGLFAGSGSLLATLAVAATYDTPASRFEGVLLSLIPLTFALLVFRTRDPDVKLTGKSSLDRRASLRDLRTIATILLTALIFFQFGSEWALGGWLPLFLIHRLGSNPVAAILMLAIFFAALTAGRALASSLLPRISHRKLLIAATSLAMCGYLLMSFTPSLTGATAAVILLGAGFAPIFPLVAERLDERFVYHPGFYNGTIAIAITGAMSVPWALGFVDAYFGMRFVMLVPAFCSLAVLVLALLLMLEAHLMGSKPERALTRAAGRTS